MPELTKTKEPDEKRKKEMFKLYKNICTRSFSYNKKKMLISTILGYEDWAWRVVGISKEALIRCKRNDYNRPKGLVRDHINERKETYKRLIEEHDIEPLIHSGAGQSVGYFNDVRPVADIMDHLVDEATQVLKDQVRFLK